MTPDPKRLLGGYATDSLTEEERSELLLAALDDQELFDALADEEGLRELLESPGARRTLVNHRSLDDLTGERRQRTGCAFHALESRMKFLLPRLHGFNSTREN